MQPYDQNPYAYQAGYARSQAEVDQGLRAFMLGVYNNMILGLATSALVALGVNKLAVASSQAEAVARIGNIPLTSFGRTLYATVAGSADLGEAFATARRITPGDHSSWYREWTATGDSVAADAAASAADGHRVSARQADRKSHV